MVWNYGRSDSKCVLRAFLSCSCVDLITGFSRTDLVRLSTLPIVPTDLSSTPKLLPPTKCHLVSGQDIKPTFYTKLFTFINFGFKANRFLGACGAKNEVTVEDIAQVLIENPERFFGVAGGYKG